MMDVCSDANIRWHGSEWMDVLDCCGTLWLPPVQVSQATSHLSRLKLPIPALLRYHEIVNHVNLPPFNIQPKHSETPSWHPLLNDSIFAPWNESGSSQGTGFPGDFWKPKLRRCKTWAMASPKWWKKKQQKSTHHDFHVFFYVFFKLCFIYCILFFAFNGYIRFAPLKRTESLPSKEPWYLKKVQTPCSLPGNNPASRPLGICSWDGMSLRLIYAEYGRLKMYKVRKVYVIDM